jgi:hypothetical protein
MTKGNLEELVQCAIQNGIFIPKKINFKLFEYNVKIDDPEYKLCTQRHNDGTSMEVIVFRRIMMLDWDDIDINTIERMLSTQPYTFYIYQTHRGYHGYCVSKYMIHTDLSNLSLMSLLKCDPVYISFCRCTGYVVRTSKKIGRDENFVERFVKKVNEFPVIDKILNLLELKDSIIQNHRV